MEDICVTREQLKSLLERNDLLNPEPEAPAPAPNTPSESEIPQAESDTPPLSDTDISPTESPTESLPEPSAEPVADPEL